MKTRLFGLVLVALISCRDNEFTYPLVFTGEVTDIGLKGAMFHGKISDLGGDQILQYGFVWDSESAVTVENAEKFFMRDPPSVGVFSQQISTTLRAAVTYYVRAFAMTRHRTVYGKEVAFRSQGSTAPVVSDFIPKAGNIKDKIIIIGNNFSHRISRNKVKIGGLPATVLKSSQDTLTVEVPELLNVPMSPIEVSIEGSEATAPEKFALIAPVINDFNSKEGTFGSQIIIEGNNFLSSPSFRVYVGEWQAMLVNLTDELAVVNIPAQLNSRQSQVKVVMNNLSDVSETLFKLSPLSVINFTPQIAVTGNTITLHGNNFSPVPSNNKVTIGGLSAVVKTASVNTLEVTLPLQDKGYYSSRNSDIAVEVIEEGALYPQTLLINDQWFRHNDSPVDFPGSFFSVGGDQLFFGINDERGFWSYNLVTNEYKPLADFPGLKRSGGNGFAIGQKIYFGTGTDRYDNYADFWEYDIATDLWIRKNDFPGIARMASIAFCLNGAGYLGCGVHQLMDAYNWPSGDFWKYDPSADLWSEISSIGDGMWEGISVVAAGRVYIGIGGSFSATPGDDRRWYVYDPDLDTWNQLAFFPRTRQYSPAMAFELGGFPYVKTVASDFYRYVSSSNSWERVPTGLLPSDAPGIAFSIGNIAYVGIGRNLWEYDPSR